MQRCETDPSKNDIQVSNYPSVSGKSNTPVEKADGKLSARGREFPQQSVEQHYNAPRSHNNLQTCFLTFSSFSPMLLLGKEKGLIFSSSLLYEALSPPCNIGVVQ